MIHSYAVYILYSYTIKSHYYVLIIVIVYIIGDKRSRMLIIVNCDLRLCIISRVLSSCVIHLLMNLNQQRLDENEYIFAPFSITSGLVSCTCGNKCHI